MISEANFPLLTLKVNDDKIEEKIMNKKICDPIKYELCKVF